MSGKVTQQPSFVGKILRAGVIGGAVLLSTSTIAQAETVTPQMIQGYIAHADPAKALRLLDPILKAAPHSAKAWYLEAEALDASGHDQQARVALQKSEDLSPSMPFANPHDLRGLERRVHLSNVKANKESATLWRIALLVFLGLLGMVMLFMLWNWKRRKHEALKAETSRQDTLMDITQFLTGDLNAARISADANSDSKRLADIQRWRMKLIDATQALKNAATKDAATKQEVAETSENLVHLIRQKLANTHTEVVDTQPDQPTKVDHLDASYQPKSLFGNMDQQPSPQPAPTYLGVPAPAAYQNQNNSSGGGLFGAVEQGLGMGLGMEIVENLMDGWQRDNWGDNGSSAFNDSASGDGIGLGGLLGGGFGGVDNGLGDGLGSNFGGDDDGLDTGGDDSFGGDDDGLSSSDDSF